MHKIIEIVKGKKVLFITTKNIDYIRNTQEIRIIRENAKNIDIICSNKKNNPLRILHVWTQINKKRIQENDIVFVGFEPQFVVPFLGKKFGNRFLIIDCFISVYDTLICDRKLFRDGGVVAKISYWMDEKTIKRANHIITDTQAHSRYFINEFKGNSELFETIYLEADPNIYYPRPQNKPQKLKDKFVVLYFGSILPLQGVDVVLDSIAELKGYTNLFFDIIGPIPSKYKKPIQNNICYSEWLSQEELALHIANADLCLAGHFNSYIDKADRTIPGKAYIYELMMKKMILGKTIANQEIFKEDEMHLFVDRGSPSSLSKKILELYNDYKEEKNGKG